MGISNITPSQLHENWFCTLVIGTPVVRRGNSHTIGLP
jgi:hypothetical protein